MDVYMVSSAILQKKQCCWSQRKAQALWASETGCPRLIIICPKPRKGTSAQNHEMFNASSSKFNSSTSWGTLLRALRQVHFQTSVSSTIVTLDHLYFTSDVFQVILLRMLWDWCQSAKSVFLLTSTINQTKFNKSTLHKPPSHLVQKTVLLISKIGASCVSRVWASF